MTLRRPEGSLRGPKYGSHRLDLGLGILGAACNVTKTRDVRQGLLRRKTKIGGVLLVGGGDRGWGSVRSLERALLVGKRMCGCERVLHLSLLGPFLIPLTGFQVTCLGLSTLTVFNLLSMASALSRIESGLYGRDRGCN